MDPDENEFDAKKSVEESLASQASPVPLKSSRTSAPVDGRISGVAAKLFIFESYLGARTISCHQLAVITDLSTRCFGASETGWAAEAEVKPQRNSFSHLGCTGELPVMVCSSCYHF